MKKRYNIYIFLLCALFYMSSCQEEIVDEFTLATERWESLDDFIESTDATKTVVIEEASEEFVIQTDQGLIRFPQESIINPLTNATPQGQITLEYSEIDTYSGMFFENIDGKGFDNETVYAKYIIKADLSQGNIPLQINSNNPPVIYLETNTTLSQLDRVFTWLVAGQKEGWFINTNIDVQEADWDFTSGGKQFTGSGLKIYIRETGYTALGEHEHLLYDMMSDYSTVSLEVDQEFQNSETKIYIARHDDFTLIPMELNNGQYIDTQIRENEPVTSIGITVKDEKLYFAKRSFIVGESNDFDLIFNESTFFEIIEELRKI